MKKRKKTKRAKSSKKSAYDIMEQDRLAANKVIELTNDFCKKYLNDEYRELCEDMAWTLYEVGLPIESGKPSGWASGIVHALGWVNFLHDPSQTPHMRSTEIAEGFGVSQQTMLTKSKIIRDELDLIQLDPDWCTVALLVDNPLVWTIDVGGFLMDARHAPPEIQQEAYRLGLIPFIPAKRQEPKPPSDSETNVIKFPVEQSDTINSKTLNKQKDEEATLFEELER